MTRSIIVIAIAAALSSGCNKSDNRAEPAEREKTTSAAKAEGEKENTAKPAKEPEEEAKVMTAGEPETKVPDTEVPTQEDFEEEATTKMASANLELELDALESEIGE